MERTDAYLSLQKQGLPVAKIERIIKNGAAPGGSLSIISNNEIKSLAFGYFDDSNQNLVTPHTLYDLASISKLFTTALILRLQESDQLSIEDHCSKYLANFSNSEVNIRDLLTHRVDFGVSLSEYREKSSDSDNLKKSLESIQPPVFPSSSIHYANLGFIYLGNIIEKVGGKSLDVEMNNLFNDLHLNETTTGVNIEMNNIDTPITEVIQGNPIHSQTHDETARILGGIAGNAGVFSSAEDLARFGKKWLDGSIVQSDTLKEIVFRDYDISGQKPQGLGWWMRLPSSNGEISTPNIYSHTGYTGSILAINPENGTVCAFTCNRTFFGRNNMQQKEIWELLMNFIQQ